MGYGGNDLPVSSWNYVIVLDFVGIFDGKYYCKKCADYNIVHDKIISEDVRHRQAKCYKCDVLLDQPTPPTGFLNWLKNIVSS